jgi:hypothetical protein
MRLALTGAAGNLGAYLLGALSERHDVVPIDRRPVDHPAARVVDLADLEGLVEAFGDCRALVHFAGEPAVEAPWESVLDANLIGVRNAFEAARGLASSGSCGRAPTTRWAGTRSRRVSSPTAAASCSTTAPRSAPTRCTAPRRCSASPGAASTPTSTGCGCCPSASATVDRMTTGGSRRDTRAPIGCRSTNGDCSSATPRSGCSQRDLAQLVERGLEADFRYACVYGVSANPNRFHDLEEARRVLGYVPVDAAVLEPR